MKKWKGVLVRKEYFRIEVEADTWAEAKNLVMEAEIEDEPVDIDWEVYDLEEGE